MYKEALAFLKKDYLVESSYKFAFLSNIFGVFTSLLSYFYINKLFGEKVTSHLQTFGVNYFSYVLLSMAFFSYIGAGFTSYAHRIYSEQIQGTLEAIFLTPVTISTILFSMSIWNLIFAAIDTAIYIILGITVFKINFANCNLLSCLVILILTITSFSGLGIFSAGFVLVFKRGTPLSWIINNVEGLLGGVYFPITILPAWLQYIAKLLPITYAVKAIELAAYRGFTVFQLKHEIIFLTIFSLLLLPSSIAAFTYALKKAQRNGTLGQY